MRSRLTSKLRCGALVLVGLGACTAPDGSQLFRSIAGAPYVARGSLGAAGAGSELSTGTAPGDAAPPPASAPGSAGSANTGAADAGRGAASGGARDAGSSGAAMSADAAAPADAGPPACTPREETCNGLDDDCDGEIDEGNTCPNSCIGFGLKGRGYMFCALAVAQAEALDRCSVQGMRLAWVETPEENAQLTANIVAAPLPRPAGNDELLTYIGGSDAEREGVWRWVGTSTLPDGVQFWQGTSADTGGEAVGGAYANWAPTEPNDTDGDEDCAVLSAIGANNRAPGNWDDRSCDTALPFVCEAP